MDTDHARELLYDWSLLHEGGSREAVTEQLLALCTSDEDMQMLADLQWSESRRAKKRQPNITCIPGVFEFPFGVPTALKDKVRRATSQEAESRLRKAFPGDGVSPVARDEINEKELYVTLPNVWYRDVIDS